MSDSLSPDGKESIAVEPRNDEIHGVKVIGVAFSMLTPVPPAGVQSAQ